MYNQRIYVKEIDLLHVTKYESYSLTSWTPIIVSFFSEFDEMKSCMYRVETANAVIGL